MRVSPTGQSVYHNGNEIGRYGRDIARGETYLVHYHSGIGGEPLWAMDVAVEQKISVSVDTILVVSADLGLHAVDRDAWSSQQRVLDGREQYVISDEHDAVSDLGDPSDHLQGELWITPETAHGSYHKAKNH